MFVPFEEYEAVFQSVEPARDGQFKVQLVFGSEGTELYLAQAGRFNIEGYFGWEPSSREKPMAEVWRRTIGCDYGFW